MAIPDNPNFSLEDVAIEVGIDVLDPTQVPYSLDDCFTQATLSEFDNAYEGSRDRLSNFRNYGGSGGASCNTDFIVESGNLRYSAVSSAAACSASALLSPRYGSSTAINSTAGLYTDNDGTCTPAPSGFYSNGTLWQEWNSTTESFVDNGFC